MNAYLEAKKLYDNPADLAAIIDYCSQQGVVIADHDIFFCGMLCKSGDQIMFPSLDKCDSWYVFIASGNIRRIMSSLQQTKYVIYERFDNNFRTVKWSRLWAQG